MFEPPTLSLKREEPAANEGVIVGTAECQRIEMMVGLTVLLPLAASGHRASRGLRRTS